MSTSRFPATHSELKRNEAASELWAIAKKIHALGSLLETWQPEMTRKSELSASGIGMILVSLAERLSTIQHQLEHNFQTQSETNGSI